MKLFKRLETITRHLISPFIGLRDRVIPIEKEHIPIPIRISPQRGELSKEKNYGARRFK